MKIYRIALDSQFQASQGGNAVNGEAIAKINLQNMQNAQAALSQIDAIIEAAGEVNAAVSNLEKVVGVGDTGIKQDISNKLNEVLEQNPDVKLIMQSEHFSTESFFDPTLYGKLKTDLGNKINAAVDQQAQQAGTQQPIQQARRKITFIKI